MMENGELSPVTADLYFLIHKFLSSGALQKTLKVFDEELDQTKILPKRIDWEGNKHERTIDDLEHQFSFIRPDYLLQLCCRSGITINDKRAIIAKNPRKVETLFSINKNVFNEKLIEYNFKQLSDYVKRRHLVPIRNVNLSSNIVNVLLGREISGPFTRKWIVSPRLYSTLQFQRRTLGHLSAVYCLLFDHTGGFIITGADDLLIKLWSSRTGRLINTFRGASSEITDIAINLENTLLAAGSIDRILRIWNLQSGAPVAVLSGHTGMITSVNFCPSPAWDLLYLITTSGDGSVAFWAYNYDTNGKVNFCLKPTMYQEKMRPGQAQMICSSFSPGGIFLAAGSGDHHVRVYYMKGDEGPHRILETNAHSDRVDSIQWAHTGLRFLSGSKDGTAIIWSFECQQWKTLVLDMTMKPLDSKKTIEEPRKLKVTMVTWDLTDSWAITAVSDYTLKIWNAQKGQLYKVLTGHTDEVYVLEAHPHDRNVILSAGHDGQLFVWDIIKGEMISKFLNTIENQGHGAIFDVKWSPDGSTIAASDSHGHLLIFGFGTGNPLYEQLPKDLFFHTDYRPLVRDTNHYVLDEQTQIPPHLMPPPFLVDIDGNPYPPMLQRLVPGREHCKIEQLVPSIVLRNEGTQEVIQVPDDNNGNNIRDETRGRNNRRTRESEGVRQSTGDWQNDPTMKWKKHVLVQPLKSMEIKHIHDNITTIEKLEMQEYHRQLRQRPHMINTSNLNENNKNKSNNIGGSGSSSNNNNNRGRKKISLRRYSFKTMYIISSESTESDGTDSTGYSDWVAEDDINSSTRKRKKKRTRRRKINYGTDSNNGEDDDDDAVEHDDEDDDDDDDDESEDSDNQQQRRLPITTTTTPTTTTTTTRNNLRKEAVLESYRTSEWLTEVRPRKTPYFPQLGDEVVYFPQGHHLYLDAVRTKKIYEINNNKTLPWIKMNLRSHEFVKIVGIQYEIKPPRLCNLKLALLDDDGRLTGRIFYVKYHDMPDVLDFFVLKQNFEIAMSRDWKVGDKFRCMIDDAWWIGEIVSKSTASEEFRDSPFLLYEIKWDNGEAERMSPWDMEPLDSNRIPENSGEALPVLEDELNNILYQPNEDDWPNNDRDQCIKFILSGLSKVMQLAIAEPFLVPVDLNTYPAYALIIQYPIDLSTIRSRFENRFYRRVTAAQFDVRHIATNAEKFNERHSTIVKHARILTELCLRIIKHCTEDLDVSQLYHQLVDTYDSTDTEVDVEIVPSSSRMLRSLANRYLRHHSDWKTEAKVLLDAIWESEDSVPFRTPVNTLKYTDYHLIIKQPMDLSIVKEKLLNNKYDTPEDFYNDIKLIFQNSRTYNTNQRSRIYAMTVRLAAIFEEHITKIIRNWRISKRRNDVINNGKQKTNNTQSNPPSHSSSTSSSLSELSDDNNKITNNHSDHINNNNNTNNNDDDDDNNSDSDSDNLPLNKLKTTTITEKSVVINGDHQLEQNQNNSDDDDSEDSYKPVTRSRKRKLPSSSSSASSSSSSSSSSSASSFSSPSDDDDDDDVIDENSSDDDRPLSQVTRQNGRSTRRNQKTYTKRRRKSNRERKIIKHNDDDDDGDDESFFTSVSSRGRVRKLNPRVRALMKN